MYVYNAAWLALAVVMTGVLGVSGVWTMRHKGWRPALFVAGLTLLPMALYLTGTLRVIGVIVDQVASYFVGFAFSPKVWAGVILGGAGLVLMATASALKRRGIGGPGQSTPSVSPRRAGTGGGPRQTADTGNIDDMDDIDAILRKHGIQ